jgi:hypothetical protein
MQMLVKVPGDLHGASLLKAHSWVKSQVARTNPGGSSDYSLSNPDGNKLSLSDITRNPNTSVVIEVTTLDGVRKNPAAFSPLPEMQFEYPEVPRSGNDIMSIMPGEIDPALATRIIAEQGLNRGLHTLNRLVHETAGVHVSSPTTAALIQISEAIRKNPRTPFTKRSPNFYNAEKALSTWVESELGLEIEAVDSSASIFTGNAKIAARYGLNKMDIQKFAKDVLSDFLVGAAANRGFLRALLRNNPTLRADRETVQKIVYMLPMSPEAYYNGRQRVLVAHPMFIYPIFADTLMTKKFSNQIVKFASGYPQNITNRPSGPESKLPKGLSKYVNHGPDYANMNNLTKLQNFVTYFINGVPIDSGDPLDNQYSNDGYWGTITGKLTQSMEEAITDREKPLTYHKDIGGFYPSPPPKWPQKLVYAIMDTFLQNLPYLMNTDLPISDIVLDPIRMVTGEDLLPDKEIQLTVDDKKYTVAGKIVKEAIARASNRTQLTAALPAGHNRDLATAAGRLNARNVLEAALQHTAVKSEQHVEYDASGPKSILEMAYEVAETAMGKYDYKMSGDDFTFVMAMMTVSFHTLHDVTEGDFFEVTTEGIPKALRKVLGRDAYERLIELKDRAERTEMDPELQAKFDQTIFLSELQILCNQDVEEIRDTLNRGGDEAERLDINNRIRDIRYEMQDIQGDIPKTDWSDPVKEMAMDIVTKALNEINDIILKDAEALGA